MGGFDTMITDKTRNILIESAWWDPVTVRKSSRRHGIHTDASHRFERGADFESTILSCDLVAALILESGGGELVGDADRCGFAKDGSGAGGAAGFRGAAHTGWQSGVGRDFPHPEETWIRADSRRTGRREFRVQIPSWRLDVEREIDVIEEIARLHGYDKFENTLPAYSGAVVEVAARGYGRELCASGLWRWDTTRRCR